MESRRRELNIGGKPPATKEFGIKGKVSDENLEKLLQLVHSRPTFDFSSFSSSSDDSSDEKSCSKQRISNAHASYFTEPGPLKGNSDDEDEEEEDEDDETETYVVSGNGDNKENDQRDGAIEKTYDSCREDNWVEVDESEERNESLPDSSTGFDQELVSDQNLAETSAQIDNTENEKERFLEVCVRHEDGKRSNAEALRLFMKGDHDRAIHEFYWAAEHCHNISAYYHLGLCFMEKKDFMKAICYYKVAAADDHAKASYNIACIIFNYRTKLESKYTEADGIMFLKRAAELGLKQAQTEYGIILMETKETVEVAEVAAEFLELAARQNYPRAMYHLGICYEKGLGVGVNCAKAADLYSRAGHGQHPEAQHNLAVFYEWGLGGLMRNKEEAMNWYKEAVKNGHQESMDDVRRLERMDASKDEVTVVAEQPTFQNKPFATKGDRVANLMPLSGQFDIDDMSSGLEME